MQNAVVASSARPPATLPPVTIVTSYLLFATDPQGTGNIGLSGDFSDISPLLCSISALGPNVRGIVLTDATPSMVTSREARRKIGLQFTIGDRVVVTGLAVVRSAHAPERNLHPTRDKRRGDGRTTTCDIIFSVAQCSRNNSRVS